MNQVTGSTGTSSNWSKVGPCGKRLSFGGFTPAISIHLSSNNLSNQPIKVFMMKKIEDLQKYDECMGLLSQSFLSAKELMFHTNMKRGKVLWLLSTLNKQNKVERLKQTGKSFWKLKREYRVNTDQTELSEYEAALLDRREKKLKKGG